MSEHRNDAARVTTEAPNGRHIVRRPPGMGAPPYFGSAKGGSAAAKEIEDAMAIAGIEAAEQARDRRRNNRMPADVAAAFDDEE